MFCITEHYSVSFIITSEPAAQSPVYQLQNLTIKESNEINIMSKSMHNQHVKIICHNQPESEQRPRNVIGYPEHMWKATPMGLFFPKNQLHFADLIYTDFQKIYIMSFVPVNLNSNRRTRFRAQSAMSKPLHNQQHVRVKAQSKKQNQKTKFFTGQSDSHRRHSSFFRKGLDRSKVNP